MKRRRPWAYAYETTRSPVFEVWSSDGDSLIAVVTDSWLEHREAGGCKQKDWRP